MLKQKIKAIMMVSLLTLGLFSSVSAAEVTQAKFAVEKVQVKDASTLLVDFTKELYNEVNLFEVALETKETKELVAISKMELSKANQLSLALASELNMDTEYNFTVIFATDKDGNVIENGVDGMASFVPNNVIVKQEVAPVVEETAPVVEEVTPVAEENVELNAAQEVVEVMQPVVEETSTGMNAAAVTTQALPETGPKEVLFVVLAMLLSFAFLVSRRKA